MRRKLLISIVIIAFLLLIFGITGKYVLKWANEREYSFNSELQQSIIFVHNDLELNFYELNTIKSLIEFSISKVDSLLPNNLPKVNVYISSGNNSATTIPEYNKITLYNSEDCYAPFCHEYIHVVLGAHKELWFSEGVSTFLGQEIRSRSKKLQKYCDGDEKYLIGERKLTGGILNKTPNLLNDYSYNSIKELIIGTNRFSQLTDKNKLDYYFFSASFCKYIFESIGESEMINMILKIKESHNSISREFSNRSIDLDKLMDSWLIEFKE